MFKAKWRYKATGSFAGFLYWLSWLYGLPGHWDDTKSWWKILNMDFTSLGFEWTDIYLVLAVGFSLHATSPLWMRMLRKLAPQKVVSASGKTTTLTVTTSKAVGSTHLSLRRRAKNAISSFSRKIGFTAPIRPIHHPVTGPLIREIQSLRDELEGGLHKAKVKEYFSQAFFPSNIHSRMYKLSKRLRYYWIISPEIIESDLGCYTNWIKFLTDLEVDLMDSKRTLSTNPPF